MQTSFNANELQKAFSFIENYGTGKKGIFFSYLITFCVSVGVFILLIGFCSVQILRREKKLFCLFFWKERESCLEQERDVLLLGCTAVINIYTYLEFGRIRGEPNGAGFCRLPGAVLAMSGWRKFLLCSTLSWCWTRHFDKTSGNNSNWSYGKRKTILKPVQCVTHNLLHFPCSRHC